MASGGRRGGAGERVLESKHVIGLFMLMLLFSGVFFTLGYVMGRNQYDGQVRAASNPRTLQPTPVAPKSDPSAKRPADVRRNSDPATDVNSQPNSDWSFYNAGKSSSADDNLKPAWAAVSGAALSLSYTGFYFAIYSWLCIGLLLIVILDARPRVAFACGFVHALFFVLTSMSWIATVLAVHGGLSRVGGCAILLLIATVFGIFTGTFAWSVRRLAQRSLLLACVGAPFLWVTFEFAFAHMPEIGFPWNLLGYPASNNLALLQLATVTGIWGLSFFVAAFNSLVAWTALAPTPAPKTRFTILAGAVVLILFIMAIGPRFVPQVSANHYARAVQTNFPEAMEYPPDWFQSHAQDFDQIEQLSLAPSNHPVDLLVWPEAPAPFSFEDPQFARRASQLAIQFHHPFLAGCIQWEPAPEVSTNTHAALAPYNSAILLDPQGQKTFAYDKVHLVPFGEYEPFPLIHRVAASFSDEIGGFRKGRKHAVGHLPGGDSF